MQDVGLVTERKHSMKLQIALDILDLEVACDLIEDIAPWIDIVEAGTPLLKYAGAKITIPALSLAAQKPILADLKTMDAGAYEAEFAAKCGADFITVLGVSDDETVLGAISEAHRHGIKCQVDLMNVPNKVKRAVWAHRQGADLIGIHTGIDQQAQGQTPLADLAEITQYVPSEAISVAGGINLETLPMILPMRPGVIVIGGAITQARTPVDVVVAMKDMFGAVNV